MLGEPLCSHKRGCPHLKMQWAAVSTHCEVIREPPHRCLSLNRTLTCQGHFPSVASAPPTIFTSDPPQSSEDNAEGLKDNRPWLLCALHSTPDGQEEALPLNPTAASHSAGHE